MSRYRLPTAAVLLFALAACQASAPPQTTPPPPPVDVAALKDAIQAREKEWSAAFLAANATDIANLYTEDGATIQPTGEWRRGRPAIAAAMQPQFDSTTFTAREDITEEVIPVGTDYVFEVGHYSSSGTLKAGGAPRSASGRYVVLWRKDADGVWRLHRDLGSEVPAKP
jgi:uncharacterized protein (TIGR02246 family)